MGRFAELKLLVSVIASIGCLGAMPQIARAMNSCSPNNVYATVNLVACNK